jgi:uncharacterized protein (TIGR03067 family)
MRRVLPLIAVLSLAFAPAPFPRPAPSASAIEDLKAMQGEWVRSSLTICGKTDKEQPGAIIATIRGNHMAFGTPSDTYTFTLDASQSPKWIESSMFRGVYEVKGNTLTLCFRMGVNDDPRPMSFDPAQQGVWLEVFKRKKP